MPPKLPLCRYVRDVPLDQPQHLLVVKMVIKTHLSGDHLANTYPLRSLAVALKKPRCSWGKKPASLTRSDPSPSPSSAKVSYACSLSQGTRICSEGDSPLSTKDERMWRRMTRWSVVCVSCPTSISRHLTLFSGGTHRVAIPKMQTTSRADDFRVHLVEGYALSTFTPELYRYLRRAWQLGCV
jgi:hypothetical protein